MRNVIAEVSGYKTEEFDVGVQDDEQDIYFPALVDNAFHGTSSRMHMRAKHHNIELMQQYGLKPVVQVRNLFDIVVSLRDHCRRTPIFGIAHMGEVYNNSEKSRQYDMVIDLLVPWYLSFFVSWTRVKEQKLLDTLWVSYEEMMGDKVEAFTKVCDFYDIPATEATIKKAISAIEGDKRRSNFNVGKVGRGKAELSEAQVNRIRRMAGYYEDIDFSLIGIS